MTARAPVSRSASGWWAWAPWLTIAAFALPVVAGLVGTGLPALGYLPAIGGEHWSLEPWRVLLQQPGIDASLRLSLQTGLLATVISLGLAAGFCACAGDRHVPRLRRCLRQERRAQPAHA